MPQRNGYRSSHGRSAIARTTMFSQVGKGNASIPSIQVKTQNGNVIKTGYFGGNKKGGAAPNGTGFLRGASGLRNKISTPARNQNFLFSLKTNPGPRPYGLSANIN